MVEVYLLDLVPLHHLGVYQNHLHYFRRNLQNPLQCFRYWNVIGTDCGRCMVVCPYSHPDNAAHNMVRRAIRRSGFARRMAL